MSDRPGSDTGRDGPNGRPDLSLSDGQDVEQMLELCRLVVGMDRQRLHDALRRLEDRRAFAEHLSAVLADATRLGLTRDDKLAKVLAPVVASGVHETVRREPVEFGKALAPAMGPAIRQSVWLMIRRLTESFERTLEQRLSLRSLRWRWEARRTGKSFAEVVFLHTVAYRVEHTLLVHRETGLLLLHASLDETGPREPDLMSAMVTAIQDFGIDALETPEGYTLGLCRFGDLNFLVETGERAILTAFVRGDPPQSLRLVLRETLERIHVDYAEPLHTFDGDASAFELARPELEGCLIERQRELPGKSGGKGRRFLMSGVAVAVLLAIAWFVYSGLRESRRWEDFVERLRDEPGIVVTRAERDGEQYLIAGLRDPLAPDPEHLAREHEIDPGRLVAVWEPFHAQHPDFALPRLWHALDPPSGVSLHLEDGRLTFGGRAGHEWIVRTAELARLLPGVAEIDMSGLVDADAEGFEQAIETVRSVRVPLRAAGRADREAIRRLGEALAALQSHGRVLARGFTLVGRADVPRNLTVDADLARRRFERVFGQLDEGPGAKTFAGVRVDPEATGATLAFDIEVAQRD